MRAAFASNGWTDSRRDGSCCLYLFTAEQEFEYKNYQSHTHLYSKSLGFASLGLFDYDLLETLLSLLRHTQHNVLVLYGAPYTSATPSSIHHATSLDLGLKTIRDSQRSSCSRLPPARNTTSARRFKTYLPTHHSQYLLHLIERNIWSATPLIKGASSAGLSFFDQVFSLTHRPCHTTVKQNVGAISYEL